MFRCTKGWTWCWNSKGEGGDGEKRGLRRKEGAGFYKYELSCSRRVTGWSGPLTDS
jgi:hypothetical protein